VVEIEDKQIGKTPLPGALSYPAGSYTVRITKDGYQEYLAVLDVESNDTNKVQISLEKEGKTRWGLWTGLLVGAVAAGTGTTIFLLNQGDGGGANAVPEGDLGINRF
jgi:hypothetical protein